MPIIRLKRGTAANIEAATLQVGEPAFATDTDELYIGTATGKVKLAKAPHGNEAHSPDFLAVDGSNVMQNTLSGLYNWELMPLKGFTWGMRPDPAVAATILPTQNELAFLTARGGSVSFTPVPDGGGAAYLFDGEPSFVYWLNPSGTIEVEVSFPSPIDYVTTIAIYSNGLCFARDFVLEVYDASNNQWVTVAEKTGWEKSLYAIRYYSGATFISKLRFTATAYQSSGIYRLSQIVVCKVDTPMLANALSRGGGDMYGNINMHSNKVTNLADPTAAQDAATKSYADGKLPLDTSSAIDAYMSGNKWLSVATSGIVGLPEQSACRMHQVTQQTVPTNTDTKVILDGKLLDIQNEGDTTNYRITVTEDGIYSIYGQIRWDGADVVAGSRYVTHIFVNGALKAQAGTVAASSGLIVESAMFDLVQLSAGDYVELYCWHNTGADAKIRPSPYGTILFVAKIA